MASGGVVGSRPGNDTAEPGAVVVGNGWEPTGSGGWDRGERGLGVIASGRPSAVEQLTEQHAQRVDVAAPVDRSSRELLGRTVAGRADDGARVTGSTLRSGGTALAIPKSVTRTEPSTATSTLLGLTSRWTTPWSCAHASASAIWAP